MTIYCRLKVKIKVSAPFLCSATGPSRWGIDASFHRDYLDQFCIPKSHIKGKLKEAWKELCSASEGAFSIDIDDIDHWLGRGTEQKDHYKASKGLIRFSDFVLAENPVDTHRSHRIKIEKITGTTTQGALICAETPFKSGKQSDWEGVISFPACDETERKTIENSVLIGLRWITAFGTEKSVGFGRVMEVNLVDSQVEHHDPERIGKGNAVSEICMALTQDEPVTIGAKRIKDNYLTTETIFSGALIKGAVADCIRQRCGLPKNSAIEPGPELTTAGMGTLAKHFTGIRFSHGFPSTCTDTRPVFPPLSITKDNCGIFDAVSQENPFFRSNDKKKPSPPEFICDWKDTSAIFKDYGWARPRTIASTHTAIEPLSRRSADEKLYTFELVCPADRDDHEICRLTNIRLPDGLQSHEKSNLYAQIKYVLEHWLTHIGKRDAAVKKALTSKGRWTPSQKSTGMIRDGMSIITLQTDALILNPWEIKTGSEQELKAEYTQYWEKISERAFRFKHFFASHVLYGGYVGQRYRTDGQYYPFLLTCPGSVFVLEAMNETEAQKYCDTWLSEGIPSPDWSLIRYGKTSSGKPDWQKFPYVRENGYGEITVNLPCHWEANGGDNNE